MTDLIPRDAALAALDSHAHGTTTLGGQTYRSITLEVAVEALQAIPAIDPAAIREAALREALEAMRSAGSFGRTAVEKHAALEQYCLDRDAILALIGEKK